MTDPQPAAIPQTGYFRWLLLLILLLGLGIRLGAAFWWESRIAEPNRFFFGDSLSYEVLARQIAHGDDFVYGDSYIARTPGYPLLLAPFYWFSDQPPTIALRLVGIFCGVAAIGLTAWLTRMLFGPLAGLIAAVLVCFYPGAIAMSVFVLSEAPFVPLMLLNLGWMVAALRSDRPGSLLKLAALAGAAFGLAILVRPSWMMFPFFAAPIGLLFYENRRQQLKCYVVAGLVAVVVMSPWWVRNYRVTGKFVPTTLQVGASLYDGISPMATGASDMRYVPEFRQAQADADAAEDGPLPGTYESRLDDRMKQAAIKWARQNPGQVISLAGVKLWRYWTPLGNNQEVSGKMELITAIGYLPLVLTGIAGAICFARRGCVYLLLALPIVYFCCLHLVFVSSIRYRQPPMLALVVLSAGLLASWLGQKSSDDPASEAEASVN
ncbi:ArnT family glycosyltransferase [Bremerella cremea]|uniref:ArnT family glycosyltransferase n=1 Tax=Bremerella cremea TaxID=1031537 RepID=UPI0031E979EC